MARRVIGRRPPPAFRSGLGVRRAIKLGLKEGTGRAGDQR